MNNISLIIPISIIVLILLFADTKTKDQTFQISFNTYRLILLISVTDLILYIFLEWFN